MRRRVYLQLLIQYRQWKQIVYTSIGKIMGSSMILRLTLLAGVLSSNLQASYVEEEPKFSFVTAGQA